MSFKLIHNISSYPLSLRHCDNTSTKSYIASVGVSFKTKTTEIAGEKRSIRIFDTAGQEQFRIISKSYIKNSDGVIILYNATNPVSYQYAQKTLPQAKLYSRSDAPILFVGETSDANYSNSVPCQELLDAGREFASTNQLEFFTVSATRNENVDRVFDSLYRTFTIKEKEIRKEIRLAPALAQKAFNILDPIIPKAINKLVCSYISDTPPAANPPKAKKSGCVIS